MQELLDRLSDIVMQARAVAGTGARDGLIRGASDDAVIETLALAGEIGRLVDALLVESVAEIAGRSVSLDRDAQLTTRLGCRSVTELIQRVTRLAPATARRLESGAKAVAVGATLQGEPTPAQLPALREALIDGAVGLDAVVAVSEPLEATRGRVPHDHVLVADALIAESARGEGPDGAPPACADLLRIQARAWAAALDQDGAEPRDAAAERRRGVTLGAARDGVVPIRGNLLPEVAAQLQTIFNAVCSPRADQDSSVQFRPTAEVDDDSGLGLLDDRTTPQKQHDALATAVFVAASSRTLPTIGGAAPTLVVSVRAEDLAAGTGWAHAAGADEPLSLRVAARVGCTGTVQRVLLGENGRIERLGTEERVFNRHQRRAIALRDGGCIIPGCSIPAGWCEIHHVREHSHGGPTHTDNGVLLCWFHHRTIDRSPWQLRMNRGIPEVQAPRWFDPTLRWRPTTKSPTRLRDRVIQRTDKVIQRT